MPLFPASRSTARTSRSRWLRVVVTGGALWMGLGACVLIFSSCRSKEDQSPQTTKTAAIAAKVHLPSGAPAQTSVSCRSCHEEIFGLWQGTDHALANQDVTAADLATAFAPPRTEADGNSRFQVEVEASGPVMTEVREGTENRSLPVVGVLGYKPTQQMLLETEPGRLQPVDLSWHPETGEWFNVFGDEGRRHGEWGHWSGRGMNWNSMCAHCHMTGFRKNYHAAEDRYHSSWVEQGIGCIQCHGPVSADHAARGIQNVDTAVAHWIRDRKRAEQTCAYCHARNESLTAEFPPGALYEDHFRLTLPVQPGVFWPDGQQRDEDFNWTSVKLSRMHHAGVSCMDCHDPHSSRTILPVENNALCMQCHSSPGRTMPATGVLTPVIDPTAHSRHATGSTGNQCVSCHMPTENYMQRSPRHDHGWLKPDPLMTKELGIPNACNRCHEDQSVDWAIAHTDAWYGEKMDSRQRARARAIASAQRGDEAAVDALLALAGDEDIPAWRATYLQLLARHADHHPEIVELARAALNSEDAMERASAVQALTGLPEAEEALRAALQDPVRLVRLDAAWALPRDLSSHPETKAEFEAYLDLSLDQPAGRLRRGQYLANLGRYAEAAEELRIAVRWDRYSAGIFDTQAAILQAAGDMRGAASAFYRAAQLQPGNGEAMFRAGLAYAEAGLMSEAATALTESVRRDPYLDRAWYNLGLLQVQSGQSEAGIASLRRAIEANANVADYAYALATVYWQTGDREAALAAAREALLINPQYGPARQLLQRAGQ